MSIKRTVLETVNPGILAVLTAVYTPAAMSTLRQGALVAMASQPVQPDRTCTLAVAR